MSRSACRPSRGLRQATVVGALLVLLSMLGPVAPASGVRPGPVQASIAPEAMLLEAGAAVLVEVTISCTGGSDVLEAFVYVTQDGQQSPFTPIAVRCGGGGRTYQVRVPAPPGSTFHTGSASASAFVLVAKKGDVSSASPGSALVIS